MSWLAITLLLVSFLLVFAEFGGRIRAANALAWWLIAIFLATATIAPNVFLPLTQLLGITLVSNFVMATLILFLFVQVLQLSATQAFDSRKLRTVTARLAAERFLKVRQKSAAASSGAATMAADDARPRALVILPCYNEEKSIPQLVPRLRALQKATPSWNIDFCFVDDGSRDDTRGVLRRLAPHNHTYHLANGGVSCALLTGFHTALEANIDYVVQCDGDGQHPVEEIARLLEMAKAQSIDLLIGSRFAKAKGGTQDQLASTTWMRRSGSLVLISALKLLWPRSCTTDPTSGFRVFSQHTARLLLRCMPDDFPEPETIGLCLVGRLCVQEVAVEMSPRTEGQSSIGGLRSIVYMYKSISALIGLRLRTLFAPTPPPPDTAALAHERRSLEGSESNS